MVSNFKYLGFFPPDNQKCCAYPYLGGRHNKWSEGSACAVLGRCRQSVVATNNNFVLSHSLRSGYFSSSIIVVHRSGFRNKTKLVCKYQLMLCLAIVTSIQVQLQQFTRNLRFEVNKYQSVTSGKI